MKIRITLILIIMFLNFLGFSILFPILPFMVARYVTDPGKIALQVGFLISAFALCQFLAAPGLGTLSDRFGRRPILLISLFGSVIGYLLLGIGGALWVLFLGRVIDGITGGNISTIFAYVADITEPRQRGKYYGMLGAAGGAGMIFGPAVSGFTDPLSLSMPLYLSAAVTTFALIFCYFLLPESLPLEHKIPKLDFAHLNPFRQFYHSLSLPILRRLFPSSFLYFLGMFAFYGNNAVFLKDVFRWNPTQIGILLFIVGFVDIFSQGFLMRKLIPKFGDANVALAGQILTAIGFLIGASTVFFTSPAWLYTGIIVLNIGDGLFEPSTNGLISSAVGPKMQGRVQGANQGMQSIARILAPLYAAWIYQYWQGLPYTTEALLVILSFVVLTNSLLIIKNHKPEE
jgi:DHA1 family tetracycline resistance protein-like MFS transporter